jgi:hypothetical protein
MRQTGAGQPFQRGAGRAAGQHRRALARHQGRQAELAQGHVVAQQQRLDGAQLRQGQAGRGGVRRAQLGQGHGQIAHGRVQTAVLAGQAQAEQAGLAQAPQGVGRRTRSRQRLRRQIERAAVHDRHGAAPASEP